jgi:hypothetical protein
MNQTRVAFPGVTDYWTRCKVSSNAITIKKKKKYKKKGNLWSQHKNKKEIHLFFFSWKIV